MYKKILFLVGVLTQLVSFSALAQKTPAPGRNSLLWKVSGKGLEKPSYLFGTIHMICSNDYFFNDAMKKALNECEKLILEINLTDPDVVKQYQQSMMLPAGKELKHFFTNEEEFKTFAGKLKTETGIDALLFNNLKPLILLSLIAQKSFECENTSSYEMNLMELGKNNNMTVEGLETSISQMKIFDDMKDEEIKRILMEGLTDMESDNKVQHEMIDAYKKQDIEALHKLILTSKEFQNQEDALINDRNKNWVEQLPKLMKEKTCFIAVGAGHLAGSEGVIKLLQKQGYEVSPVEN